MDKIEKIWEWLDGKKTILGLIGHISLISINLAYKDLMTLDTQLNLHLYIGSLTSTGFIHKLVKILKK